VRVGALEPGVGDEAVGRLREVDAVPADVRVGVLAGGGAGEPAGGAHVVVERAAAAAAGAQSAVLVTCNYHIYGFLSSSGRCSCNYIPLCATASYHRFLSFTMHQLVRASNTMYSLPLCNEMMREQPQPEPARETLRSHPAAICSTTSGGVM
jgi:hypothetical protein